MSETENQRELTAEEIAEFKKTSIAFYKERIAFMKIQFEFESLSADIDEAKLRGLMARLKMAHITAPPQKEDLETEDPETTE